MVSYRWSGAPQAQIAWGPAEPPAEPQHDKPDVHPWQTCSMEQIRMYRHRKFRALYDERKFARPFPKQKQTLSFTDDLPAEIRLLVYDNLFETPDNYFELWGFGGFDKYAKNKEALKILRLCKKVHEEAADHFYGHNNFRFSSCNGLAAMAVFHHTLGRANCDFIRHITVKIPKCGGWHWSGFSYKDEYACVRSKTGWNAFVNIIRGRGMQVFPGRRRGQWKLKCDRSMKAAYGQLRNMASLRTLEILIPWDYYFIPALYGEHHGDCQTCHMYEDAGPRAVVRHCVEAHSSNPEFWTLLADLKERATSKDLTISLVLKYDWSRRLCSYRDTEEERMFMRQGRWLAAYASVMGYRFGHTSWPEGRGTYVVRYDEDERLSVPPDQSKLEAALEPPELP